MAAVMVISMVLVVVISMVVVVILTAIMVILAMTVMGSCVSGGGSHLSSDSDSSFVGRYVIING
jgi:hypothetical protein